MHVPTTSHVASVGGTAVAVHDYGGEGTPTLFVHGTGMCGRMWEPVMDRLPLEHVRPLVIDLRGHGAAVTPADATFHDHEMVADVVAVIDAFEIEAGFAVAHSMGAGASILASLERPVALDRVWAFEPILMPRNPDGLPQEFLDGIRKRRRIFANRAEVFDRYSSRPPLDELDHAVLWAYLDHGFVDLADGTVQLACDPLQEALAFEQFLNDGFERLGEVTSEVLVAYGGADTESPPSTLAPDIAAEMPKGRTERFPEARHFGPFGDLQASALSIERFLVPPS